MTSLLRLSAVVTVLAGGAWSWGIGPGALDVSQVPPSAVVSPRAWTEADLWLAPLRDPIGPTSLARAVELVAAGRPEQA
jgi:hypothetical protein